MGLLPNAEEGDTEIMEYEEFYFNAMNVNYKNITKTYSSLPRNKTVYAFQTCRAKFYTNTVKNGSFDRKYLYFYFRET